MFCAAQRFNQFNFGHYKKWVIVEDTCSCMLMGHSTKLGQFSWHTVSEKLCILSTVTMFAQVEFCIKSIVVATFLQYSSFTENQYYGPKVHVMLYEYGVHVTLVKREICIEERCRRKATVTGMILAGHYYLYSLHTNLQQIISSFMCSRRSHTYVTWTPSYFLTQLILWCHSKQMAAPWMAILDVLIGFVVYFLHSCFEARALVIGTGLTYM